MKLDIGCGGRKRGPDYVGVDIAPGAGVDVVINIEHEALPFPDSSVDLVYSSHCFEHLATPNNVWSEISRVIRPGGSIEIWTPYPFHHDQWLIGHVAGWGIARWRHLTSQERAFYSVPFLGGGYWRWHEARFVVGQEVRQRLERNGTSLAFAVHHLNNVVEEWGCFFEYCTEDPGEHTPRLTFSFGRDDDALELCDH